MIPTLSATEVFDIAVQIERAGGAFYRAMAATVEDAACKELLLELADMEDEHESLFERMRSNMIGDNLGEDWYDPDSEAAHYLVALAENPVFKRGEDAAIVSSKSCSVDGVLELAIAREKEAVLFFSGIRELVPNEWHDDKVDDIIREEMGHVALLNARLHELREAQ